MEFHRSFYRTAAICSFISAITTLGLIFLPRFYAPVEGFEGRMSRVTDPAYVLRSWIYLVHPFLVMTAALGVALARRAAAPASALCGFLCFLLWGFTEAGQQAMTKMMFDRWRAAWPAADEAMRTAIRAQVPIYDGLWDAMYFLLLIGFLFGCILLGASMRAERGLGRAISLLYYAAAFLTLAILSGELGGPTLPSPLDAWFYPAVQPLARTLIGVWLWRQDDVRAS